jgi:ribonuclease HI
VDEWLHQAGLSPDYAKRELMHYTRRKKDGSPSITFDDRDGKRRVICPESHVRWLGVHFDRKLRFTHHIKLAAAKGTNAVCALAMLANTVRGLHQTQLRHLYIACVLPKILYAAPVWANGKANQLKPLEKVQRRALLHMCAAFRTTPTIALEVEASLPPLHIQIKQIKAQFAIRLNKLPPSSPVLQRLGNHWRKGKKPKFPPPLPPKLFNNSAMDNNRSTPLLDLEKLTSHTHERTLPFHSPPWRRTASSFQDRVRILPHRHNPDSDPTKTHNTLFNEIKDSPRNIIAYSDGSYTLHQGLPRTGAAMVVYYQDEEVKTKQMGLGGNSEVYDAEMAGLMMAAAATCKLAKRKNNANHIFLFADNTAAMNSIFDPKPGPAQLYAIKTHKHLSKFLDAHPDNQVTIAWCPGHKNIRGNERADKLAKEARNRAWESLTPHTLSRARRKAKAASNTTWRKEWCNTPKLGGYAMANQIPPSTSPTKTFCKTPREVFGRLIQCRTNHGYTGEYRRRFFPQEDTSCPCGVEFQSREHIVAHCMLHEHERGKMRKVSRDIWLPTILGTKTGIIALTDFLQKTTAFTRNGQHHKTPPLPLFYDEPEDAEDPEL